MNRHVKRVLVLVLGWVFVLIGIAGLFLPVIQGILCLLIGLMILSSEYVWAHRLLQKLKARFPRIAAMSEQATAKAEAWLGRLRRKGGSGRNSEPGDRANAAAHRNEAED